MAKKFSKIFEKTKKSRFTSSVMQTGSEYFYLKL